MDFLFETSWEVCNKVGGIYTVLKSKAPQACAEFGENYFVFGPWLQSQPEFKETNEPCFEQLREPLAKKGLRCRMGRWLIPGNPKAILVDFHNRYDVNQVLYGYWRDFGVDSYAGGWDYMEPILFSTAVGEVIEVIHDTLMGSEDRGVAHFHEWMTGGGLLYLRKHLPEIGVVFTTHATMLGRCIAGLGRAMHLELDTLRPREEANTYGVAAKHSMETACAQESDIFTTVSRVTAEEATVILGRHPDRVVQNGLNIHKLPDYSVERSEPEQHRRTLLNFARNFLQKDLPDNTRLWITSGRYEYHNKGYDIFLESLGQLEAQVRNYPALPPVVALFTICADPRGVQESVHRRVHGNQPWDQNATAVGVTTHHVHDEPNDPIIRACQRLQLNNGRDNKVNVIFSPAYLDGHDGILDLPYESVLSACDLGVFASFYEPWGYTPLESIAYAVPTITTDLAGFGDWAAGVVSDPHQGVSIVPRKTQAPEAVMGDLTRLLFQELSQTPAEHAEMARRARRVATQADWEIFFRGYSEAYQDAIAAAQQRFQSPDKARVRRWHHSDTPSYRTFTVVSTLPNALQGLYDIAHNLWWTWNPDARRLFAEIDSDLWVASKRNPIELINKVDSELLERKTRDKGYMALYRQVLEAFQNYLNDGRLGVEHCSAISAERPIAYFSMEYGLHECLPVYSGGLGILSGDHLKTASDLNMPLIGIGLFYRNGYFTQYIDADGNQQETYNLLDCSAMPIKKLLNDDGTEAKVQVKLPGRNIFLRVWVAEVGRTKLFLMDADVQENEPDDRWLCAQLYGGDRRTRIKQEMVLGIGGARLVREVLKLQPSVWHMNEGHCAFLTMERIKEFLSQGLSFQEAKEAVRASTCFTTHTPVPAGNENFEMELLAHYMREYVADEVHINWEQFVDLGADRDATGRQIFSMTVLALKLSGRSNAVAKLHGKVSRKMWTHVWKNLDPEEVPIFPITNGIHTQTWLSPPMRQLLEKNLPIRWGQNDDDPEVWNSVEHIADDELWSARQQQKKRFIEMVKTKVSEDYTRRGETPKLIRETVRGLSSKFLTIGFARRVATYKRGALFLKDFERIARLLGNDERPVQLIIAGKAHPADGVGKQTIRQIVEASRAPELKGRLIYLENYDMGLGRLMTSSVDVWMNNPIRPMEASGTSGMKVCPNGGLNFSILDGWWDEAYDSRVGWKISSRTEFKNAEHQDEIDNL
ncbi:MAG: alpha-glucan family phosphorylase, partial [Oligoflexia bacterium]|nr:alpha-glucan family phosphorylase [Oligoflexia bacterium]